MKGIILMLLNYFHDLAVAVLAVSVLSVYIIGRILDNRPVHEEIIPHLFRKLSRITWGALAFVLAGGFVRAFFFMEFEWSPAVGKGQIPALVVKHVILVTLTAFGLVLHRRYRIKYDNKH